MTNILKHRGVISGISGNVLKVTITQTSACASCSVKNACHVSDKKEKCVDVLSVRKDFRIGDEVTLVAKESMGLKAVLLAFVLPFLILVTALAAVLHFYPGREAEAAILSVCCLIPYYMVLYASRKKLSRIFTFELED